MDKSNTAGSTSLLSKKFNIVGEIEGNEDMHVEGRFKGSIKITGNILVGPTGVVDANVEAENIIIQGKINGNVLARHQLEIQSMGQLIGDCSAQSIDIKEAAIFEGRSSMLKSAASPGPSTQPGIKGHPK